jgi:hypothetical protein
MFLIRILGLLIVSLTLGAQGAAAETVSVSAHKDKGQGQGWIFRHLDTCWMVTAKHVVDGASKIVIASDGGATASVDSPTIQESERDDVAVMRVEGLPLRDCTGSVDEGDTEAMLQRVALERRSIVFEHRDSNGLGVINIRGLNSVPDPRNNAYNVEAETDTVHGGDSGALVRFKDAGLEGGVPLGMITNVIANDARDQTVEVLRWDVVVKFIEGHLAAPSPGIADFDVEVSGSAPDAGCPQSNLRLDSSTCVWHARRVRGGGPIVIVLDLGAEAVPVSGIYARLSAGALPEELQVFTSTNPSDSTSWVLARSCAVGKPDNGISDVSCDLPARDVRAIRINVIGNAADFKFIRVIHPSGTSIPSRNTTNSAAALASNVSTADDGTRNHGFDVMSYWVSEINDSYSLLHIRLKMSSARSITLIPSDFSVQYSTAKCAFTSRGYPKASPRYKQTAPFSPNKDKDGYEERPLVAPAEDMGYAPYVTLAAGEERISVVSFLLPSVVAARDLAPVVKSLQWVPARGR